MEAWGVWKRGAVWERVFVGSGGKGKKNEWSGRGVGGCLSGNGLVRGKVVEWWMLVLGFSNALGWQDMGVRDCVQRTGRRRAVGRARKMVKGRGNGEGWGRERLSGARMKMKGEERSIGKRREKVELVWESC